MSITTASSLSNSVSALKVATVGKVKPEEEAKNHRITLGVAANAADNEGASVRFPHITESARAAKTKVDAQVIGSKDSLSAKKAQSVEELFLEFAKKSPEEKIREAYLKRHGLTEEDIEALPPEERLKIEDQIKREIKADIDQKLGLL